MARENIAGIKQLSVPFQPPNSHGSWQSQGQCLRSQASVKQETKTCGAFSSKEIKDLTFS